jgi:hypothetical protein
MGMSTGVHLARVVSMAIGVNAPLIMGTITGVYFAINMGIASRILAIIMGMARGVYTEISIGMIGGASKASIMDMAGVF